MAKLTPPEIKEVSNLKINQPIVSYLDNGIPVYDTRMGDQEVLKLEIIFDSGRPVEQKRLVSRLTNRLLKEGTQKYSGKKIAELFDYYGATLQTPVNLDHARVTLYTLKKHFEKLLPILKELLSVPTFPEDELENLIARSKHRLAVDLSKSDTVAYRLVTEKIFGEGHYYGYNSNPELFDALTQKDIKTHFKNFYGSNYCKIFISGKTDDSIVKKLNKTIGKILTPKEERKNEAPNIPICEKRQVVKTGGTVQTAIRIGCHLFNRKHPDYFGFSILNTVLGGYFGSRLISTIREEKGYTYNVYSLVDSLRYDGCFYISTEVGNEFVEPTIKGIYEEMDKLRNVPIDADELKMVRRYLLGNMLSMLDGPFNNSDVIRTMVTNDLEFSYFDNLVKTVKDISAAELQALAQKYFQKEKMWEVVVG